MVRQDDVYEQTMMVACGPHEWLIPVLAGANVLAGASLVIGARGWRNRMIARGSPRRR